MTPPNDPPQDAGREFFLELLGLGGAEPEARFDRVVRLAAKSLRVPLALFAVLSGERVQVISAAGSPPWPREGAIDPHQIAFCRGIVTGRSVASNGEASATDSPVDTRLGVPVRVARSVPIGALCVMDDAERSWSESERSVLVDLSEMLGEALDRRLDARLSGAGRQIRRETREGGALFYYQHDLGGVLEHVSASVREVLGYDPAELIGRSYEVLLSETEDASVVAQRTAETLGQDGAPTAYLAACRHRDGRTVVLEIIERRLVERGRVVGVAGFARDVSERVDATALVQATEERFSALISHASDVITVIGADGRIRYESPAVESVLGYTPEEVIGRDAFDFIHPDERAEMEGTFAGVLSGEIGPDDLLEMRLRHSDGSWTQVEAVAANHLDNPAIAGIVVNFRDVTEHHEQRQELKRSLSLLRATLEATGDGILVVDRDGRAVLANPAFRAIWGISRRELRRGSVEEVLLRHTATIAEFPGPLRTTRDLTRPEEGVVRGEMRLANGREYHVYSQPRRVDRAIDGRVWSFREITHLRRTERALKESEERFRQAQKMEAIGRLAGGMAHDFNNLLTAIGGNAELALMAVGEEDPVRDDLLEIRKATERATDLTGQLLLFARKRPVELTAVDLVALVRESERLLRRMISEDITMQLDLPSRPVMVYGDEGQLTQVLVNLVVNARDALPAGGRIGISIDHHPGRDVRLRVRDNGLGMDAVTRERIFEPFFTTKPRGKGTGLGLATVYGIVQQSRGDIEVDSAPGAGTTFCIRLPECEEVADCEDPSDDSGPLEARRPAVPAESRVLVVEDDPAVRMLIERVLRRGGYEAVCAGSADEAVGIVENQGEVDLLITDMVLPERSGTALAREIEQRCPAIPVLLVSGYSEEEVERRSAGDESYPMLPKPFTPDELLERVAERLR